MLSDATLAYAEDMTAALLGADALYRAEAGDGEGLVVVNMSTTPPEPFAGYDQVRERFEYCGAARRRCRSPTGVSITASSVAPRLALFRWRAGLLSFAERIHDFLHVPADALGRRAGRAAASSYILPPVIKVAEPAIQFNVPAGHDRCYLQ